MKRLLTALALLLLAAGISAGASYTVAWDPNPAGENVLGYRVRVGGTQVWQGTATQATINANPADVVTVRAYNVSGESADSAPLTIPATPTAPKGVHIVVSVTVQP